MRKLFIIKFSGYALLSLLLFACNRDSKKKVEIAPETAVIDQIQLSEAEIKNATIGLGKLEMKTLSTNFKVSGKIDVPPQNLISISVPMGGYLKSTKLMPGLHISKGETIAIIEDQQYIKLQEDYLTIAAKLKYAESEYNRQSDLNTSKAASDKVFQQAESDYMSLKIAKRALNEKLELIGIHPLNLNENNISRSISIPSPIDGYVSTVNVNIGKYVNPSDVLFELVNPDDIHLALTVFEKDLNKLFIGQSLLAYNNSDPDTRYPCKIILIGKDLSEERSVQVHCHFENFDKKLIPGMFMNAQIDVNQKDAYTAPEESIVSFNNKNYIFIEAGKNQFKLIQVEVGITENGVTEIKNSLELKSKVIVIKDAYTLLMKMKNKSDE